MYLKQSRGQLLLVGTMMALLAIVDVLLPLMSRYGIDHFVAPRTTEGLGNFVIPYASMLMLQVVAIFLLSTLPAVWNMAFYTLRHDGFQNAVIAVFLFRPHTGRFDEPHDSDAQHVSEALAGGWLTSCGRWYICWPALFHAVD